MSAFKVKKLGYMAAASALLALFAAQGCGDDNKEQAGPSGGKANSSGGAGGKTSAGAGGKTGGAGAPGAAGTTPIEEGGAAGTMDQPMGMGGEGGEGGAQDCSGPEGCYACQPTTNKQFLNHCVEDGCPATFDNTTLSNLDKVGTL
jgi:hypothetical protein